MNIFDCYHNYALLYIIFQYYRIFVVLLSKLLKNNIFITIILFIIFCVFIIYNLLAIHFFPDNNSTYSEKKVTNSICGVKNYFYFKRFMRYIPRIYDASSHFAFTQVDLLTGQVPYTWATVCWRSTEPICQKRHCPRP